MRKTKIIICGARGRMGQLLIAAAKEDPELEIAGTVDAGEDLGSVIAKTDVVIDFTIPEATPRIAGMTAAHGKALVIGTTGHTNAEREAILKVTQGIPVVWSSNFAMGVNVLFHITRLVGESFSDASVEISETHHTKKKDAPSGTAKTLKEILEEIRGNTVPVESRREGDVVGDHTVLFKTPEEELALSHHALARATFAKGALRAAKWIATKRAGLYDMQDVLGLK